MASDHLSHQVGLKYLGFFEVGLEKATKYAGNFYDFAKGSTGPLRPGVDSVESKVISIVRPVYQRVDGKPQEMLLFVDKKMDVAVSAVEAMLPQAIKQTSCQAYDVAKQVPESAKILVSKLQTNGLFGTAKLYYATLEPIAEEWSYATWKQLLKLPCASQVVQFVAPPTLFCAEKFNQVVDNLQFLEVPLAGYIPFIPVDKLERAVKVDTA